MASEVLNAATLNHTLRLGEIKEGAVLWSRFIYPEHDSLPEGGEVIYTFTQSDFFHFPTSLLVIHRLIHKYDGEGALRYTAITAL